MKQWVVRGHHVRAVVEYLPGKEPSAYDLELSAGGGYWTRYWRCTLCGQERNHRREFQEACDGEAASPLRDGGYDIGDARTRRALTEDMTVHYGRRGSRYTVDSASGARYEVDIGVGTCTCPDYVLRHAELVGKGGCKHLRRVDLAIRAGTIPGPDGTFEKSPSPP